MMLAAAFLIALAAGLSLTPIGIRLAWATGYLDHPEARKLHTSATPLLGGFIVFVCATLAWALVSLHALHRPGPELRAVISGAIVAVAIGMWDDRFGMWPLAKLLGQAGAAMLLVGGTRMAHIGLPGPGDWLFTVVSVVALMNATNFLDNMNGMVGGITAIAMAAFAWDSAYRGELGLAAGQLAVSGACVGFLRYNYPRGRLFLGDAGSLFLGYSLAASGLLAYHGAAGRWARPGAIIMLGYPVFDMVFVVVTRLREGRHVYEGGKDHTNHRLASVLGCQKRTVKLIWLVGAALSASGLVVLNLNRPLPTLLSLALWMSLFLVVGVRLSRVPVSRPEPSNPGLNAAASPTSRT